MIIYLQNIGFSYKCFYSHNYGWYFASFTKKPWDFFEPALQNAYSICCHLVFNIYCQLHKRLSVTHIAIKLKKCLANRPLGDKYLADCLWNCPQVNDIGPHWWSYKIGSCVGVFRQQAITWTYGSHVEWRHVTSLGHNELTRSPLRTVVCHRLARC